MRFDIKNGGDNIRTKDEILCLIEEYRKLGRLRFRLSAIEDKIRNDFYSDEFDMQYHDELVLQIKKTEIYFNSYGVSKEYARAAIHIENGYAETLKEHLKEHLKSFSATEIVEFINFAIELERHECYIVLLNFARQNDINLKPQLAL